VDAELQAIVEAVRASPQPSGMSTRVVAVDGLAGAGKSTLARRLAEALDGAPVLQTDDFASWEEPLDWWPRLLSDVLEPLARDEPAQYLSSSWGPDHPRSEKVVRPSPFLVLEGVSASRRAFRPYISYAVWVETPRELRLRRGLERDGEEARALWERWAVLEDEYVAHERPHEAADVVVAGDSS
jgi:uridine kinase